MNKIFSIKNCIVVLLILSAFVVGNFSYALNDSYSIHLDKKTIQKGYTVSAFDESLKLSLVPGILNESTRVLIEDIQDDMKSPWNMERISKIYQFEFLNKNAYDDHKPFYIQFAYNEENDNHKQVFFYDKNYNTWRPLPTRDFPDEKFVRSLIHLPFARIAVFSNSDIMTVGKASWYAYKGGDFAASPDFPKKSKLRVYNLENNKFVDIEVNDYGPDRSIHPDRAIDLDKVAFSRIASIGAGIIDVKIEPLYVAPEDGKVLGVSKEGVGAEPKIDSKSAIVVDSQSGDILFSKNAEEKRSIASLTKLVAVKVFFDTKPDLKKVVAYSKKDEEYNYEYCSVWESSRVRLKEGDQLTLEDLVYSSLVGSANNAVETLVRASSLSRDVFIRNMNSYAKNLDLDSTKFVEPTGLSTQNVSSASDYAIIMKDIMNHPIIKKISSTFEYKFTTVNTDIPHRIRNTNKLLRYNDRIVGSKTGYLNESGYCLATEYNTENGAVFVILLGASTRSDSFYEIEDLFKFANTLKK